MYYMETALGQYARLSPLQVPADKYKQHHHRASSYHHSQVWRCSPIATGVGVAMLVVSLIVAIYYNVIMAYSIIYVGVSFRGITDPKVITIPLKMMTKMTLYLQGMPWSYCGDWWGANANCRTRSNFTDDPVVRAAANLTR